MNDLILQNITKKWVNKARISYVKAFEPLPYLLAIKYTPSRLGYMQTFKTIRQAKINFTKEFYKGIWKESDKQN
jgi:hypothetical protein